MQEEKKYDIELDGNETLVRKYDWLPYSYSRIESVLEEVYHAELISVSGYKEGRYNPNYKRRYAIEDIATREVINPDVRLDDVRRFLANKGIPLRKSDIPQRNKGAEEFNRILKQIRGN